MPIHIIVILAIVTVIVFLLFSRVKVLVGYSDKFNFTIKYLFVYYRIKTKETGKAKKEKKQAPKMSISQVRAFLELFERFKDDAKKMLVKLKNKVKIDLIKIDISIGGDDPAQTAMTYGVACAVVFPAVSALELLIRINRKEVFIAPAFNSDSNIVFDCRVSIRLGSAISVGIVAAVRLFISLIKNPIDLTKLRQRGAG
jgi:hypothetical protein